MGNAVRRDLWPLFAVFALALATRLGLLAAAPSVDELLHILTTRSILAEGSYQIGTGVYDRAWWFSWLIAQIFSVTGESPMAGRLVSVLAGAALPVAVFAWVRTFASSRSAWIAAALVVLWPSGIILSQFLRFYALHGLAFFCGIALLHMALAQPRVRWGLLVSAVALLAIANSLQVLTLVGLAGAFAWLILALVSPSLQKDGRSRAVGAMLAAIGLLGASAMWASGQFADMLALFFEAPPHIGDGNPAFWFYLTELLTEHTSLTLLTPLACVAAVRADKPAASLCIAVAGTALAVQSISPWAADRYIAYVVPFLFVIWALALDRWVDLIQTRFDVQRATATAFTSIALIATNLSLPYSLLLAVGFQRTPPAVRWENAGPELHAAVEDAVVVASFREFETLYTFGRVDVVVNSHRTYATWTGEDFDRDVRTGWPVVNSQKGAENLIRCTPGGLFLIPAEALESPANVFPLANTNVERLDLGEEAGLAVFMWRTGPGPSGDCDRVADALIPAPPLQSDPAQ